MTASSTIAARCTALSAGISQIIIDASNFARRLRESRHDINTINADLLTIKLSLSIGRDDFMKAGAELPTPMLETMSGLLDYCATATEELHKHVVRISAGDISNDCWNIYKEGNLQGLRQDLGALKSALDLFLDLANLHISSEPTHATRHSTKKCACAEQHANTQSIIRRTGVELSNIEELTEGRLPTLYTSLEKLKNCAQLLMEQPAEELQKRSPSRSDSLDPSSGDSYCTGLQSPTQLPSPASPSSTNGIGAWIASVVSNIARSPPVHPESLVFSDCRRSSKVNSREESTPSRGTFYTESTTSGSRTQSSSNTKAKKGKSRVKTDSPQAVLEIGRSRQPRLQVGVPTVLSDERSLIHHNIISDKVAIAKSKRRQLTKDQKVAIDWDLRNITRQTTPANVERILWEGARPNVDDPKFGYLFTRAAYELSIDILRLLVEYGANITKTSSSSQYYSAAHAAAEGKQLINLQYLIELGASVDVANANGETPLHIAVRTPGAYPIAKYLLEIGADVNREASEANTPLHTVMTAPKLDSRERSWMMELLFAHGAEGELSKEAAVRRRKGLSILGLT